MKKATKINGDHCIQYGKKTIPYKLEFQDRSRLSISVHPNRSVTVVAPENRSLEDVHSRVQKRSAWINKQRVFFEQFNPLPHEQKFISGETHLYLGRHYRLKVRRGSENTVKMKGKFLIITTTNLNGSSRAKDHLTQWYRDHAANIFQARLQKCLKEVPSLRMPEPKIIVRRMTTRWGSCSTSGNVLLNLDLIKTPLFCIEYVIMHELCHLRIHNHSPAYFRLLSRCMPDWERRKARLDTFLI